MAAKKKLSKASIKEVDALAEEYAQLAKSRREMSKVYRRNKKRIKAIEKQLKELIGTTSKTDKPHVYNTVKNTITQILQHRDVDAYSYDFIEFRVYRKR